PLLEQKKVAREDAPAAARTIGDHRDEAADLDLETGLLFGLAEQRMLDGLATLDAAGRQPERVGGVVLLGLPEEEGRLAAAGPPPPRLAAAVKGSDRELRQDVNPAARPAVTTRKTCNLRLHGGHSARAAVARRASICAPTSSPITAPSAPGRLPTVAPAAAA